jgi:NADH-quinone oxidoreductase subunit E
MTNLNYDQTLHLKQLLSNDAIAEIDCWIKKYPVERKRPPIIAALKVVQEHNGNYLTDELMQAVAEYLDVPHVAVYEVATFYTMFHLDKVGKHVLSVCNNISCSLRGADKVIEHLQNRLNIKVGETTDDGVYTIKTVECLAACGGAPMLEVDKQYHEDLTEEKIDKILSDIAALEINASQTSNSQNNDNAEAKD